MKKNGVLILSHCGYSFVDQIASLIRKEGLCVYILSSLPDTGHEFRIQALHQLADWVEVRDKHELEWYEVADAITSLKNQGFTVNACITVWEGYRALMAQANSSLEVKDLAAETVSLLRNKLLLRQQLLRSGFSSAASEPLTKELFEQYQHQGLQKFIKPRQGIASFGTFRLTGDVAWQDIEDIQAEFKSDKVYGSIFSESDNFIIEDFILGIETSFEILVVDGTLYTLAVHEKIETSSREMTVLEDACVCPPVNIAEEDVQQGIVWLKKVFNMLDIQQGCFHVEAKCNQGQWEIIEINPRVGGALISPSVEYFTNGDSMLKLWLTALIRTSAERAPFLDHLNRLDISQQGISPSSRATFFRVYFGEVGIVDDVIQTSFSPEPLSCQILAKTGTEFISDAKENFVGQALWGGSMKEMQQHYHHLLESSKALLHVHYRLPKQGVA